MSEGADLLRAATATATALARANEASAAVASEAEIVVADIAVSVGAVVTETASVDQKMEAVRGYVDARISALESRAAVLGQARNAARQLLIVEAAVRDTAVTLTAEVERVLTAPLGRH